MLAADGPAHPGLLDDQVQIAQACLDAFEVTGQGRYLAVARDLADNVLGNHEDPAGGFVDIARGMQTEPSLAVPSKPVQDAPAPGANAVAVLVLARLARILDAPQYREAAERTLRAFAGGLSNYGLFASTFFLALDDFLHEPAHVVVIAREADEREDGLARRLHATALATFRPDKIVALYRVDGDEPPTELPVPAPVRAMASSASPTRAYVCAGNACAPPTDDPEELAHLIRTYNL
jgi:hypothetical protein